jgi:hypothetical protein
MTAVEIWTIGLSIGALAVALFSLGWQIVRSRGDAPLVSVAGIAAFSVNNGDYENPVWTMSVAVANAGRSAVTVNRVGWMLTVNGGPVLVSGGNIGATTPLRLEAQDSRNWEYEVPVRGSLWDGIWGVPTVTIVKQPSWTERRRGIGVHRRVVGPPQRLVIPDLTRWQRPPGTSDEGPTS